MSYFIRHTIGLFDGDESLYAFLDDNLIYLRNSRRCGRALLFFKNKCEKKKAQTFFLANDYKVINESNKKLNIIFSTFNEEEKLHLFFLNTDYLKEDLLEITEKELDGKDKNYSTIHVYLLNSDSNVNYYSHQKEYKNVNLFGSPSSPIDMSNNDIQPF